jgi:hypothetical protein
MTITKFLKIFAINIGLAAVNIIMYSKLFLGITDRDSLILMIVGCLVSLATIVVFFYANIKLLSQGETVKMRIADDSADSLPSLAAALNFYKTHNLNTFRDELVSLEGQVDKFQKKKDLYEASLLRYFTRTELSFAKFFGTLENVEDVFKEILKGVLSRLNSFDEEEYETMLSDKKVSRKTYLQRKAIYDDYKGYVSRAVQTGDEILLKIDRLQLEVSKLSSPEPQDLEKLQSVKEIDTLISEVKWYK